MIIKDEKNIKLLIDIRFVGSITDDRESYAWYRHTVYQRRTTKSEKSIIYRRDMGYKIKQEVKCGLLLQAFGTKLNSR